LATGECSISLISSSLLISFPSSCCSLVGECASGWPTAAERGAFGEAAPGIELLRCFGTVEGIDLSSSLDGRQDVARIEAASSWIGGARAALATGEHLSALSSSSVLTAFLCSDCFVVEECTSL
jgi:hypothetical protein